MKGLYFAEWLLCRVIGRAQAAAQTGDLLEISQTRGTLWFWRAVLSTVLYRSLRPTLSFVAAFALSETIARLWDFGIFGNVPDRNSIYTTGTLILAPLCLIPVFLLLRYGWRNAHARFSLLFGFAAGVSLLFRQQLFLRWTFPAIAIIITCVAFTEAHQKWVPLQSLTQLASAIAISFGALVLFFVTFLLLWVVLSYWLDLPKSFFNTMMMMSSHPIHDLINALTCLFMVRAADNMEKSWGTARTELSLQI